MEIEEKYRLTVTTMESRGFKTHRVHEAMGPAILRFQKRVPGVTINVEFFDMHEVPQLKNKLEFEMIVQSDLGPMTMNINLFSFEDFFIFLDATEEFIICLNNFSQMFWKSKYTGWETRYG